MNFYSDDYTGIFGLGQDPETDSFVVYGFHEVKEEQSAGYKDVSNGEGFFHTVTKDEYDHILKQSNAISIDDAVVATNKMMSGEVLKNMIDVALDPAGMVEGVNAMHSIVADSAVITHNFELKELIDIPDDEDLSKRQEEYLAPSVSTMRNLQGILEQGEINPRTDGLYIVAEYHGAVQRIDFSLDQKRDSAAIVQAVESSEINPGKKQAIIGELMEDYNTADDVHDAQIEQMHMVAGLGYTVHTIIYRLDEMAEKFMDQDYESDAYISPDKKIELLGVVAELAPVQELSAGAPPPAASHEQDMADPQQDVSIVHDQTSTASIPGQKM